LRGYFVWIFEDILWISCGYHLWILIGYHIGYLKDICMDIHFDIFGYHRIYSGYLLWIFNGYLKWIFHLDKHGYLRISLGYVSKDISHGHVTWISLDMSGYLLDISGRYLFLDISERYPILPKDIQEISFHILSYPTISRHIQRYPEISKWGELPDGGVCVEG
jgi:hypothetical protein